jgi:holdfast attachment protein HfaA
MRRILAGAAVAAALALSLVSPASAGDFDMSFSFEQPMGLEYGAYEDPFEPGTRDASGNRLVVNGRILEDGSSLPLGLGLGGIGPSGFEQSSAIGNQLNVITTGSFNTVIVDAEQNNDGDIAASTNGGL